MPGPGTGPRPGGWETLLYNTKYAIYTTYFILRIGYKEEIQNGSVENQWYCRHGDLRTKVMFHQTTLIYYASLRTKTKLRGLTPHANYTDRAAAAGRPS